jgi:hypothetical protein
MASRSAVASFRPSNSAQSSRVRLIGAFWSRDKDMFRRSAKRGHCHYRSSGQMPPASGPLGCEMSDFATQTPRRYGSECSREGHLRRGLWQQKCLVKITCPWKAGRVNSRCSSSLAPAPTRIAYRRGSSRNPAAIYTLCQISLNCRYDS